MARRCRRARILDEPHAALSFQSCLGEGSQVIVTTHSPLLVSLPGATLLELSDDGLHEVDSFEQLALVQNWRQFLNAPERYLRHLLAAETDGR